MILGQLVTIFLSFLVLSTDFFKLSPSMCNSQNIFKKTWLQCFKGVLEYLFFRFILNCLTCSNNILIFILSSKHIKDQEHSYNFKHQNLFKTSINYICCNYIQLLLFPNKLVFLYGIMQLCFELHFLFLIICHSLLQF